MKTERVHLFLALLSIWNILICKTSESWVRGTLNLYDVSKDDEGEYSCQATTDRDATGVRIQHNKIIF